MILIQKQIALLDLHELLVFNLILRKGITQAIIQFAENYKADLAWKSGDNKLVLIINIEYGNEKV